MQGDWNYFTWLMTLFEDKAIRACFVTSPRQRHDASSGSQETVDPWQSIRDTLFAARLSHLDI
jgi:hypothetical protein